jgi:predicted phage terminase large subunit-like protein
MKSAAAENINLKTELGSEFDEIISRSLESTEYFGRVFFGDEIFWKPFSPVIHGAIFRALDDSTKKKLLIVAPRGVGKTTLTRLYVVKSIVFNMHKFIVPMSATEPHALTESRLMKRLLRENDLIKAIFGDFKGSKDSETEWITSNNIVIRPRSAGQQVRGMNEIVRPDLWIIDDLEDPNKIKSETYRADIKRKFYADIINTIDEADENTRIIYLGTPLHEDSLLADLMEDPEWTVVRLPVGERTDEKITITQEHDGEKTDLEIPKLVSYWPEHMSDEALSKRAYSYHLRGNSSIFNMEFMASVEPDADEGFSSRYFKHYDESEMNLNSNPTVENIILVDPAKTKKKTSDFTAIVGVGLDMDKQRIFVRDILMKRLHPDETADEAFDMAFRLNAQRIVVETVGGDEYIINPFKQRMFEKGYSFVVDEIKPKGGINAESKEQRILGLLPLYRTGKMFHAQERCGNLEAQLMSFPHSRYDDVMDALANILKIMEESGRYFFHEDDENSWISYSMDEEYYEELRETQDYIPTEPEYWGFY